MPPWDLIERTRIFALAVLKLCEYCHAFRRRKRRPANCDGRRTRHDPTTEPPERVGRARRSIRSFKSLSKRPTSVSTGLSTCETPAFEMTPPFFRRGGRSPASSRSRSRQRGGTEVKVERGLLSTYFELCPLHFLLCTCHRQMARPIVCLSMGGAL